MGGGYLNEERAFQAEGPEEVTTKGRVAYGEVEAMVRLLHFMLSAMGSL